MASDGKDLEVREMYPRAVEESDRANLLYALPVLEQFAAVASAMDVTSHNLVGAAQVERERKTDRRRPYRFALTPRRELPEDDAHDARQIADNSFQALDAISVVLQRTFDAALRVLESEDPAQRKYAARLLIDHLNSSVERLLSQWSPRANAAIQAIAAQRIAFPSVLSLSRKMNNDREDLILRDWRLGKKLPFKIDPRTTYTPYTRLAMHIVSFIDSDRRSKASLYRLVVPNFHRKPFTSENYTAWNTVVGFHLDFFQSPEARRVKVTEQQNRSVMRRAMETRLAREKKNGFRRSGDFGPFGEIPEMFEFKYRRGKPVKMSPGTLFNRVKFKVIDAAMALMPK